MLKSAPAATPDAAAVTDDAIYRPGRIGAPGPPAAGVYLPQPPTRTEKYSYFRNRRQIVFAWLLVAAAGIIYGYVRVASKSWWTSPALVLLVVMVPPVIVNFWLRIGKASDAVRHHAITRDYQYANEAVDVFLPSCGER